ncbi:hypothetical protein JCM13664_18190 [Methylothermus subterraneus]|nr:hypothetical conserved protein [uncultured Gammaproteobacteria bacterium]
MDLRPVTPPSAWKRLRRKGLRRFFGLWLASLIAPLPVQAEAPNLAPMARKLAELRAEVDRLQQELDQAKADQHQKLDALGAQIAQLEAEKRRQELALQKLKSEWEAVSQTAPTAANTDAELTQTLRQAIAALRRYVETGLPFKRSERLEALRELEAKLDNAASPKKLASELWALIEDELRLTRENGLYRQILPVEGNPALVEVAKLGMVLLFFQTPDGRYGLARRQGNDWEYVTVASKDDRQRIAALMESLRKQIRQGYFELPNPDYRR